MWIRDRVAWTVALLLLSTGAASTAGPEPSELAEATQNAGAKIDLARKATRRSAAATKAVREAFAELRPFVKFVRKRIRENKKKKGLDTEYAFAHRFNELLTVAHFHKVKLGAKYICRTRTLARRRLLVELPVTPHWKLKYEHGDQLTATVTQSRPNGKPLRIIRLWRYKWSTVYSGVGGENYKKLAERLLVQDRLEAEGVGGSASKSVTVKKLSRNFKRAYYYEVELHDQELDMRVRRREYYFKGVSATFNFAVTDCWDADAADDEVTLFQAKQEGVELMYVLKSLKRNDE